MAVKVSKQKLKAMVWATINELSEGMEEEEFVEFLQELSDDAINRSEDLASRNGGFEGVEETGE